jgi:hypothetical protein
MKDSECTRVDAKKKKNSSLTNGQLYVLLKTERDKTILHPDTPVVSSVPEFNEMPIIQLKNT